MSDAEVLVAESDESNAGDFLVRRLPAWMPKSNDQGNFKLLDTVGRAIDRIDGDITDIDNASTVQDAETVPQLSELAKLVRVPPKTNEGLEKYRLRVISGFQTSTTEGTADHVLSNAATLLEIKKSQFAYKKISHRTIELEVPGQALDDSAISGGEFVDIMDRHSAASFSIESTVSGTFTYLSPSAYSGSSTSYSSGDLNSDATKGHDGLSSGTPKNNGGTYAGLIN